MSKARRGARPGTASRPAPPRAQSPAAATSVRTSPVTRGAWWRWALLLALVVAAYGPALRADFVNWDDPIHVYENPRVTDPDALRRSWSDGRNPGFYPVLFVLSVLRRGAPMTLPAAFVLVEWSRGRRLDRRLWVSLAPSVALGVAGGVALVRLVPATLHVPPLGDRLAVSCRAFWFYLT